MNIDELKAVADAVKAKGAIIQQRNKNSGLPVHHNGGSAMIHQARVFRSGLAQELPDGTIWTDAATVTLLKDDPDMIEFMRLKKKLRL